MPKEFHPGDPTLSDSERLIVIETLLVSSLKIQDKQETRIGRLEKAVIALSALLITFFGAEGASIISALGGATP